MQRRMPAAGRTPFSASPCRQRRAMSPTCVLAVGWNGSLTVSPALRCPPRLSVGGSPVAFQSIAWLASRDWHVSPALSCSRGHAIQWARVQQPECELTRTHWQTELGAPAAAASAARETLPSSPPALRAPSGDPARRSPEQERMLDLACSRGRCTDRHEARGRVLAHRGLTRSPAGPPPPAASSYSTC